jgi:dihydroorotate dehydrogenase (NAD+) catalytic subunit
MINRLSVEFLGKKLRCPLVLPAGVMGISYSGMLNAVRNGAGVVTAKSLSLNSRKGHKGPVFAEFKGGIINSMGLCNPGIEKGLKEVSEFKANLDGEIASTPIIVSIFGASPDEFVELTKYTNNSEADFIELNLSCPNVSDEYGVPISASRTQVAEIIKAVKRESTLPVFAKLSPNTYNVKEIAIESEKAGADGLVLINGLGPGMIIDINAKKPVILNKWGGMSGPAIKPIAIKLVYEIHKEVKIPIIGTGGVLKGEDAVEMMMAGASLVGVGSGVYYRGIEVFKKINEEITKILFKQNYETIKDIKPID